MSRPCRHYGCPNLVKSRSQQGYCDEHASERTGWAKRQQVKGNTTERGYGHAWRKLRSQVLERDGYLCQTCKAKGRITPATDVDHIINKASGGTDDDDNLQSLCKACHKAKTQSESAGNGRAGEKFRGQDLRDRPPPQIFTTAKLKV